MSIQPTYIIEEKSSILHTEREIACSILIGKKYLSYAYSNPSGKEIYMIKHFDLINNSIGKSDFDEILFDLFIKKASTVKIALDSQKIMLAPTSLVNKDTKQVLYTMLFDTYEEESIESHSLDSEVTAIYSLKKQTIEFLSSRMSHNHLLDSCTPLLRAYKDSLIGDYSAQFFLAIKEEHFYLTIYIDKKLQLHQSYAFLTEMDVLYTVLNNMQKLGVDAEKTLVQLHGEVNQTETIFNELKKYLPVLRYMTRLKGLQYPEEMLNYPTHYFYNLMALVSCEL